MFQKIERLNYISVVIFKKENNVDVFRSIRDSLGIMSGVLENCSNSC